MDKELIKKAIESKDMSYSPYSNYKVGAAVLMEDNQIYCGSNIENAAYSPTICAERVAIFKGIFNGNRKIKKIAIIGDSEWTYPCGVCRQVLEEFANKDTSIIVAKSQKEYKKYTMEELLPFGFGPEDLK